MSDLAVGKQVLVLPAAWQYEDIFNRECEAFAAHGWVGRVTKHQKYLFSPCEWRVEAGGEYLYFEASELEVLPDLSTDCDQPLPSPSPLPTPPPRAEGDHDHD